MVSGMHVGVMIRGTPKTVAASTRRLLERLAPGGGYVAGAGNSVSKHVPLENYKTFLDTIRWLDTSLP